MACAGIKAAVGGENSLLAECMACDDVAGQGGPKSQHIGGINAGFVDGSARFISDFIDKGTNWDLDPSEYHTWQRLCTSGDEQVINDTDF